MKINELRIGNYLQIEDMSGLAKVYSISNMIDESISVFYYQEGKNRKTFHCIDRFNPIPLTEEWLLKFGFEKRNGYGLKHPKMKCVLTKVADADGYHIRTTDFTLEYKYIHQLQNLYHALTGEELTIN